MKNISRRAFLTATGTAAMAAALTACGGDKPASSTAAPASGAASAPVEVKLPKNIEIQLPAKAGGGTDVMARTITAAINKTGATNMTIVNNTDGGGVVAMETVRNAKADGSKLLFFHSTMLIKTATGMYDYAAAEDFKIIAVAQNAEPGGYVLVVPADGGMAKLDDFIAKAKAEPGKLMIGVETGGGSHIMSGMLAKELGIELNYVEAGSDTDKLTALVGGSIHCALVNGNQAKQYIEAGKVVALGCFSQTDEGGRCSNLPDVPSFAEQGYELIYGTEPMVLAPKDMDDATAQAIYELFAEGCLAQETKDTLTTAGMYFTMRPYETNKEHLSANQTLLNDVTASLGLAKK